MYYYKARIYSPTLGRFLQTDPIGYEDQYNLYAYVGNDPINGVDPTGLYECVDEGYGECGDVEEAYDSALALANDPNTDPADAAQIQSDLAYIGAPGELPESGEQVYIIASVNETSAPAFDQEGSKAIILNPDTMGDATSGAIQLGHEIPHLIADRENGEIGTGADRMNQEINAYTNENPYRRAAGLPQIDPNASAKRSFDNACRDTGARACN